MELPPRIKGMDSSADVLLRLSDDSWAIGLYNYEQECWQEQNFDAYFDNDTVLSWEPLTRWTRVEDGLPERDPDSIMENSRLVLISNGGGRIGYYNYGMRQWLVLGGRITEPVNVTHWRPLPAPPEE